MGQKLGRRHGFFDGLGGLFGQLDPRILARRIAGPAAILDPHMLVAEEEARTIAQLPGHLLADLLPQYLTVWAVPLVLRQVMDMFDHRQVVTFGQVPSPPRPFSPFLPFSPVPTRRVMVAGSVPGGRSSATTGRASRWAANSRSIWPRGTLSARGP